MAGEKSPFVAGDSYGLKSHDIRTYRDLLRLAAQRGAPARAQTSAGESFLRQGE